MLETLKSKAKQLKKQMIVVYLAYMHKEVHWLKKSFLLFILIYALSPMDLIPDFIPILGLLDDVILIPLGVIIAMKMIPHNIWNDCKLKAEQGVKIDRKYKIMGGILIGSIWLIILFLIIKRFL